MSEADWGLWGALFLAVLGFLPVALFFVNLARFERAPAGTERPPEPSVSVLVPARDEEAGIEACVRSILSSGNALAELIVLDDSSRDRTAAVVESLAAREPRLRLASVPALPEGWCGKQHACFHGAGLAKGEILLFLDADVRMAPDAVGRIASFLEKSGAALVSGFPRQETGGLLEKLLIPLMHFLLLGFLPMARMRRSISPAYGAGCGQLFAARKGPYFAAGGHAAIAGSLHDGVQLPRAFRRAGFASDIFDATDLARVRMYASAAQVWKGLGKNAREGLAAPGAILPWSVLLLGGQVIPPVLGTFLVVSRGATLPGLLLLATGAGALAVRLTAVLRFRHSLIGALLHPVGVALLVAIQWWALARWLAGRPSSWRGRPYGGKAGGPAGRKEAEAKDL